MNDIIDDFKDPERPKKSKFKRLMDMSFYLIMALFMIGLIFGLLGFHSINDKIILACIGLGVTWMLVEMFRRFIYTKK